MQHSNIDLVASLYRAFSAGDADAVRAGLSPDIRWHSSGHDASSGTFEGVPAVLEHLLGADHMDDFALEVIDMLASAERVAVVARSSGRRGEHRIVNDFVQLIHVVDGRVAEVWDYKWDQQALAEFSALPWDRAS